MSNPYKQNAFRILQLSSSTANAEITEKVEQMEELIHIGEITDITIAQVRQAQRQLLLVESRIKEEFFCYSLETTDNPELQEFLKQWPKNPLVNEEIKLPDQEVWTKEEIESDFMPIEDSDINIDTKGERFGGPKTGLAFEQFLK